VAEALAEGATMMLRARLIATGLALAAVSAAHAQEQPAAAAQTQLARGQQVFSYWCATCHSAGPGMPGTQALQAKYHGNPPALLLQRTDLTPQLIAYFVRNGVSVMPLFRKTEISAADLDALAAYIVVTARTRG
jgi:mono/diheme cytochrome c family protein